MMRRDTIDTMPVRSTIVSGLRGRTFMLTETTMHAPRPYAPGFRRIRYAACYLRAFLSVIVADPEAILREPERTIIRGKLRRAMIGCVPGLPALLRRKHGLTGGCISCGASCNLLFTCPHWDEESRLCSIYEDRPMACRMFPITPADLRDRDLAASGAKCGYSFDRNGPRQDRSPQSRNA
jgi:Fe-S-cluster containining protein